MEMNGRIPADAVVLLVEPVSESRHHSWSLSQTGFRVVASPDDGPTVRDFIGDLQPDVVAIESTAWRHRPLPLVHRLRRTAGRRFPIVVYGTNLDPEAIRHIVGAGALWVEIGPSDGWKLEAAIRGVLAARRPA